MKSGDGTETLNIPYQIQTVNAGSKVLAADEAGIEEKARNQSLLKSLMRGYVWREKLLETPGMTLAQLMKDEDIKGPYIVELITLTYMAPSIVEGILRGKCPANFDLHEMARSLPLSWLEQKNAISF